MPGVGRATVAGSIRVQTMVRSCHHHGAYTRLVAGREHGQVEGIGTVWLASGWHLSPGNQGVCWRLGTCRLVARAPVGGWAPVDVHAQHRPDSTGGFAVGLQTIHPTTLSARLGMVTAASRPPQGMLEAARPKACRLGHTLLLPLGCQAWQTG